MISDVARWQGQAGYVPVERCGSFTSEGFVLDAEGIERGLEQQDVLCWSSD